MRCVIFKIIYSCSHSLPAVTSSPIYLNCPTRREPSGTQFKIHNEDLFITKVAPHFFVKQSKMRSFYRQLKLWGFERVGMDNVWRREYFSKEEPEGIVLIKRYEQLSDKKKQTMKPTVNQQHQQQREAPPWSEAKLKALAATVVAATSTRSASDAVTDNEVARNKNAEINEAKKVIRAYSAVLNEISPDANRELLASLLRQDSSSEFSSNENTNYNNDKKKVRWFLQSHPMQDDALPVAPSPTAPLRYPTMGTKSNNPIKKTTKNKCLTLHLPQWLLYTRHFSIFFF